MATHLFPSANAVGDPFPISDLKSYRKSVTTKVNTVKQRSADATASNQSAEFNIQTPRAGRKQFRLYFTSVSGNASTYWSFATEALLDAEVALVTTALSA